MTAQTASLAVNGGPKSVTLPVPAWPVVGEREVRRMEEVVRSGKWSWLGPHETAFCREYAAFCGTRYCIGLANGTVTMQCALQAVGVVPGDEVIVPGLTWVATAQAALDIGADVVLVDIDPETLCIDPKSAAAAITPRTKAIVPVHLYGCMCDMDAILALARTHGLKVVEDAAHQHGGIWRGKRAGALGDAGSFSFQQSKVLTSGEGGAVITSDPEVYRAVFALKQVGWGPTPEAAAGDDWAAPALEPANRYGHNYRITEMQCALLRGGLSRLEEQTRVRDENAQYLAERLRRIGGPLRGARRDPRIERQAYYALTLYYDAAQAGGLPRKGYAGALCAEGVGVWTTYCPVYRAPLLNLYDRTSPVPFRDPARLQDYKGLRLPNVEKAAEQTALVLPHTHLLGSRDYLDQLVAGIAKVNDNLAEARACFEKGN
ncbi:MAG: L-glutamine:2-deoxy-scyllo-inosose aminotransferase [Lentisphaerae bacterium ADurb.BinA184]|nr:MAG: L-glutamine:2-deoxy-scyllo-inosose aminotransferase [Lentisphaerae bacterium ADurb.BinA184]